MTFNGSTDCEALYANVQEEQSIEDKALEIEKQEHSIEDRSPKRSRVDPFRLALIGGEIMIGTLSVNNDLK